MSKETNLILVNYPMPLSRDRELAKLPALFREIDFQPRRVTVRKRSVKVLGGLLEFSASRIIFDE